MAMQLVYLVATNNLARFLEAIRHAQAPEKISLRFLETLDFKATNDRLFIPLLKAMKFIDEAGKPTSRYHAFLDDTQWKVILAEGIRDAFSDLFRVNRSANTLSREALVGKLKSLTEGKASEAVLKNMAKTFLELVKLADFSATAGSPTEQATQPDQPLSPAEPWAETPPRSEPQLKISTPVRNLHQQQGDRHWFIELRLFYRPLGIKPSMTRFSEARKSTS